MRLNNKEKCRFRSLITKKLESMGVKDEITFVESARKKMLVFNQKTNQLEPQMVPRYRAQNVLRNMVKKLTSQDKKTVLTFLNLDVSKFKTATKSDEVVIGGETQRD